MDASYRKLTSYFRDGYWGIYETSQHNISKSRQVGGYLTENRFAEIVAISPFSARSRRDCRNLAEIAVKFLQGIAFRGAITFRTLS